MILNKTFAVALLVGFNFVSHGIACNSDDEFTFVMECAQTQVKHEESTFINEDVQTLGKDIKDDTEDTDSMSATNSLSITPDNMDETIESRLYWLSESRSPSPDVEPKVTRKPFVSKRVEGTASPLKRSLEGADIYQTDRCAYIRTFEGWLYFVGQMTDSEKSDWYLGTDDSIHKP